MNYLKSISFIFVFVLSLQVFADWIRIVGDIEGIPKRWSQLEREGVISFDEHGKIRLNNGYSLSFEGDLMKRGPFGKKTIEYISILAQYYNTDPSNPRIRVVLGNHDLNTISLIQWLPTMEIGAATDFNNWLDKNQRTNDFISRIDYWLNYNGVNDKMEWFWLELVAEKLGKSSLDPEIKSQFYPEGKPLLIKLSEQISKQDAYNHFYDFVRPGGPLWSLYHKTGVIDLYSTKQGTRFLSFHSGILTTGNFGIVPGEGQGMFERALRERYSATQAEEILQKYDFTKIENIERFEKQVPGFAASALELWVKRYNEYIFSELNEVENVFSKLKGYQGRDSIMKKDSATLSSSNKLYSSRLAALSDAGWDPVTGKLMVEANSLVYPDSRVVKGSSIPGLPEEAIIKVLALAKVDFVLAGHQPVGDGMIHRTGQAYGRVVQFLLTDTSFSPIEQEDMLRIRDDGYLQFITKNRDGTIIIVERPGHAEEMKMKDTLARYDALSADAKTKMTPESRRIFDESKKRYEANNKLGMMANGWLIVGFQGKVNEKGQTVPDYDNFVLFQKQGRNMVYKTVDIWGITSPDVKLEYAKTDLSEMASNARIEKIMDLEKHGKEVLSLLGFERLVRGRNVMVISGPALNSLTKALKSEDAKNVFENYKIKFRSWLEQLPVNEQWVFIGGGTQGFEEELNKIISEVNQKRSTPFEMVGVVAGVTGGAELDKNVSKYLPLNKAFYWDDYFTEMLPLLTRTVRAKPARLEFMFGGGGAIVGKQIREVLAEIDRGVTAKVTLLPGLSMGMTNIKEMSATDQFIQSELGRSTLESRKMVLVGKEAPRKYIPSERGSYLDLTLKKTGASIYSEALKCSNVFLK